MSALDRLENNHSSDLNQYCGALVDMLAENVPDVRSYINVINNVEDREREAPAYETLLNVIELLISILPSHSKTLQMVKNLQQQVIQSKRELKSINKSYMQLQA